MGVKSYEKNSAPGHKFPGQFILKNNSKLNLYTMSYAEGATIFRPWGDILADGSMAPWRDNEGNFGTSWFVQDSVCQAWGTDKKHTALTRCEDEDQWPTGSPLQLLFDEVKYSPTYKHLTKSVGKTWPAIGMPKHVGFIKGLGLQLNGKRRFDNPLWGVCLVLPSSAREALDDLLNQPVPNGVAPGASADDPYGHNTKYLVGDPIGATCGKVFEFDKESKINATNAEGSAVDFNLDGDTRNGRDSEGKVIDRYACRLYKQRPTLSIANKIDKVKTKDESFDEALWFMTGEEQIVNVIIPAFGHTNKDLLLYVFGDKDVLPKSYENGTTTVDMGANKAAITPKPDRSVGAGEEINLDGDGSEGVLPNFDKKDEAPKASEPVFTPPVDNKPEPVIENTANSIRDRLKAAKEKKEQGKA